MKLASQNQSDYLTFKKMIAPILIQILFWIGVITCICTGINIVVEWRPSSGLPPGGQAILIIGLGPIALRLACELLLVTFSIHATLVEIRNNLDNRTP